MYASVCKISYCNPFSCTFPMAQNITLFWDFQMQNFDQKLFGTLLRKKKKVEIKRKKKKRIYISSLFASRNQGTTSPSAREKRFFRQHCKDVNSYFI